MIEISHVSFAYPNGRQVLQDYSARFEKGCITALTGANGCGKTTLTRLIAGIYQPDAGDILIDGQSIRGQSLFDIGRRVGYLFQEPSRQLFCDTVQNEIAFGLRNMGKDEDEIAAICQAYMQEMGIDHLKKAFPGQLSQGEKQRVVLCCVLSMGTPYLMLDEPTNGLDMKSRYYLADKLKALRAAHGCGVLLVSHDRAFIDAVADREEVLTPCSP